MSDRRRNGEERKRRLGRSKSASRGKNACARSRSHSRTRETLRRVSGSRESGRERNARRLKGRPGDTDNRRRRDGGAAAWPPVRTVHMYSVHPATFLRDRRRLTTASRRRFSWRRHAVGAPRPCASPCATDARVDTTVRDADVCTCAFASFCMREARREKRVLATPRVRPSRVEVSANPIIS